MRPRAALPPPTAAPQRTRIPNPKMVRASAEISWRADDQFGPEESLGSRAAATHGGRFHRPVLGEERVAASRDAMGRVQDYDA